MSKTHTLPPRKSSQKLDYLFTWTARLAGDTLAGDVMVTTTNGIKVGKNTPVVPPAGGVAMAVVANESTLWLSGGDASEANRLKGCITFTFETTGGRKDSVSYSQIIEPDC